MIYMFALKGKLAKIMKADPQEHKNAVSSQANPASCAALHLPGAPVNSEWTAVWRWKSLGTRVAVLSPGNTNGWTWADHFTSPTPCVLVWTTPFYLTGCFENQSKRWLWTYFVKSLVNILAQNEGLRYLEGGRWAGVLPACPMRAPRTPHPVPFLGTATRRWFPTWISLVPPGVLITPRACPQRHLPIL